jgi:centractin
MNFKSSKEMSTLVLDPGSGYTKGGLALEDYECVVDSTIYAKGLGEDKNSLSFGLNALRRMEALEVNRPISDKKIQDWNSLEKFYDHYFHHELKLKPKHFAVLHSYDFDEKLSNKTKLIELFFEKYEAPFFMGINNLILSVYGYGIRNGIVLDSGESVTTSACVHDGSIIPWSVVKTGIAGRDVVQKMQELVQDNLREENGMKKTLLTFHDTERVIFKKAFVANDYEHNLTEFNDPEKKDKHKSEFELPDGSVLQLNDETFKSTEILFKPQMLNNQKSRELSLVQAIDESLKKINIDVRRSVFESLCLTGGTMDIRNVDKRIENEVKTHLAGIHSVEVMQPQKFRQ